MYAQESRKEKEREREIESDIERAFTRLINMRKWCKNTFLVAR